MSVACDGDVYLMSSGDEMSEFEPSSLEIIYCGGAGVFPQK
jgi:hypothetical protein